MHISSKLIAAILAGTMIATTVPAEVLALENTTEETMTYLTAESLYFSAGAISAIGETVVLDDTDDDDMFVADNDNPTVAEPGDDIEEDDIDIDETEDGVGEVVTPVNPYENIAIANKINSYLNVRETPDAKGTVLGKMYKNNAAIVLENLGEWYKVTSGNLTGYIAAEYVTVGDEAVCKAAATMTAKITTNSLRLRKKAEASGGIHTLLGKGQKVTVLDDSIEGWLKVKYKTYTGYISAEYADVTISYEYGETKAEEKARLAAEAANKKNNTSSSSKPKKEYKDPTGSDGQAVVDYAVQFVGNKYVWGGTSLTKGVDCSGFVMKVYEKFGIKLPHSSYKLRSVGKKVKESEMQPGDIICYKGHVAIYIGNGKIVHAASKKSGIKISNNYKYKKVITIRRVL